MDILKNLIFRFIILTQFWFPKGFQTLIYQKVLKPGLHNFFFFRYSIFKIWNVPWKCVNFYCMNLRQKKENLIFTCSAKNIVLFSSSFKCLSVGIMPQTFWFCDQAFFLWQIFFSWDWNFFWRHNLISL